MSSEIETHNIDGGEAFCGCCLVLCWQIQILVKVRVAVADITFSLNRWGKSCSIKYFCFNS